MNNLPSSTLKSLIHEQQLLHHPEKTISRLDQSSVGQYSALTTKPLLSQPQRLTLALATVTQSEQGIAKIINYQGRNYPVAGRVRQLPPLIKGDKVLFTYSAEGVIITAALAAATELPQLGFEVQGNTLNIANHYQALTIQIGKSQLQLQADGNIYWQNPLAKIQLSAQGEIHTYSEQATVICGYPIRLN